MVIALTADSMGSCSGSRCSRSMITDVSSRPRGRRGSATRFRVLRRDVVQVSAEPVAVDGRRVAERGNDGLRGNEPVTSHWCQFSDWGAVARDDESLSVIKATHDLAAVLAQLPL